MDKKITAKDARKFGPLWVAVACNARGVCAVGLSRDSKAKALGALDHHRDDEEPAAAQNARQALSAAFGQLREHFEGRRKAFDLPLDLGGGTEFQRAVWRACMKVPYGQTRAYSWIAEKISRPRAVRAVGGALGSNPIPVIVPCHRILRADGGLGGYSAGLEIKPMLLELESK